MSPLFYFYLFSFLGFFIFFTPFFVFLFRIFFSKLLVFNIVYPFTSFYIYVYLFFLLFFNLFFFFKIIRLLIFSTTVNDSKWHLYLQKILNFINYPILCFNEYIILKSSFSKYYRVFYTFLIDFYFIKLRNKSLLLVLFTKKFFIFIVVLITYVPLFIFLFVLYYDVLYNNKIEYIYYFIILLFINRFFCFVFEQFKMVIEMFSKYLKTFMSLEIVNTSDLVSINIDYNHNTAVIFYDKYKFEFLRDNNISNNSFLKDGNIQTKFLEFYDTRLSFLFVQTLNLVDNFILLELSIILKRHTLYYQFIRLFFFLLLLIIVLCINFGYF